MSNIKSLVIISLVCGLYASSAAMVVDNRYFPLFPVPYSRTVEQPSRFGVDLFFMTAEKGYGDREEDVGLPEIFGFYDQSKESQAMIALGFPSPLLDEWRLFDIQWFMQGRLQAQGISFCYDQALNDRFSLGASWLFMRVDSWNEFRFNHSSSLKIMPADELELELERRQMNQILGIGGPLSHQIGFGDIDLYLRYGYLEEYVSKFRRMDVGIKIGALIPSGVVRDINNPSSVPFGGDGFWGIYGTAEGEFELKEDLVVGISLRVSKRFERIKRERVSLVLSPEPQSIIENSLLYGVLVAPIRVNPGVTAMVSPYIKLDNVRGGLGFRLRYTLVIHEADEWHDARPIAEQTVPIPQATLEEKLRWASDYVSLSAFYNLGNYKVDPGMSPTIGVTWDLPSLLFKAYNISKTHKISLGLELHF